MLGWPVLSPIPRFRLLENLSLDVLPDMLAVEIRHALRGHHRWPLPTWNQRCDQTLAFQLVGEVGKCPFLIHGVSWSLFHFCQQTAAEAIVFLMLEENIVREVSLRTVQKGRREYMILLSVNAWKCDWGRRFKLLLTSIFCRPRRLRWYCLWTLWLPPIIIGRDGCRSDSDRWWRISDSWIRSFRR